MAPRLTQRLDRDVYQILRKFEDDHERYSNKPPKYTVDGLYDMIKKSNSSAAREKKKVLQDSIERVLKFRKDERAEVDEDEPMEDTPAEPPTPKTDPFAMNKKIAKQWNVPRRERASSPDAQVESSISLNERLPNGEPKLKRRRAERPEKDRTPPNGLSLSKLGGMDDAIEQLVRHVARPIVRASKWMEKAKGAEPTRGVLLHGPPGCGKTVLANTFAAELGIPFIPVSAPSLVAGMSGESEKQIRNLYEEAKSLAPCLVFIDEIDAIMGKRDNAQREMEKRIVAQMLTCMDELSLEKTGGKAVVTIAATNRPDSIDPALRRAGRFNLEINIGVPNELSRIQIFKALTKNYNLAEDIDLIALAKLTPGFVGADLQDVVSQAVSDMLERADESRIQKVMNEIPDPGDEYAEATPKMKSLAHQLAALKTLFDDTDSEDDGSYLVTQKHLLDAVTRVQPSAKREGFSTIPDTTWEQVGALKEVQKELSLAIIRPIDTPELFSKVGWRSPSGVLLWGPPGCGKTLLAKAVANEAKANFISIKGPELLNKFVGESERAVRQVFTRARSSAPCILFFDELDALVPKRGDAIAESSARVVNMLLTELDGMNSRAGVYIIGATNRPDMIDPAILRPGRLGNNIFVDLPDENGRAEILKTRIRTVLPDSTQEQLDALDPVARDPRCERFSGADIENLHIAAAKAAVERWDVDKGTIEIIRADWDVALAKIKPSVSEKSADHFRRLQTKGWN
ncbi:ribosome biogenesis ATPase-like protein RIX7 [Apiospora arundinis]|uniref:Ribosome biogenesis ATPase-like protein RIX7 n=1 Tax=Apiospora arundinis TaxID=335852 RepID=A0ABR2IH94_9PEZI